MTPLSDVLCNLNVSLLELQLKDSSVSIDSVVKLVENAFISLSNDESAIEKKARLIKWIHSNATKTDFFVQLSEKVNRKYERSISNSKDRVGSTNALNDLQEVLKNSQAIKVASGRHLRELKNHRQKTEELSLQLGQCNQQLEDLKKAADELLRDCESLELNQSEKKLLNDFVGYISEEAKNDIEDQNDMNNDHWKKLLKAISSEDNILVGSYKKHILRNLKKSLHSEKTRPNADENKIREAKLDLYKELLGYLTETLCEKQKKGKQKDLNEINSLFFHYFDLYVRQYKIWQMDGKPWFTKSISYPPPNEVIANKYYANLGYSMWNSLKMLVKSEEGNSWKMILAIPSMLSIHANSFLDWMERNPRTGAIMAADLSLTCGIIEDLSLVNRLQNSLKANRFMFSFLDAFELCQDDSLTDQQDLPYKAIADLVARMPVLFTVITQLMKNSSIIEKISRTVFAIFINSTIQNVYRRLSPASIGHIDTMIDLLNGKDLQVIIEKERNLRFLQLAGICKKGIKNPNTTWNYLKMNTQLWWKNIAQATGKEKKKRIAIQIVLPIIGTLPALVHSIAGTHFSLWKLTGLLIGFGGVFLKLSTFLSSMLFKNSNKPFIADGQLEQFVNEEIKILTNFYQIPLIPSRLKKTNLKYEEVVNLMKTEFIKVLDTELSKHNDINGVEKYVKCFKAIFAMKDLRDILVYNMESTELALKLLPESLRFLKENLVIIRSRMITLFQEDQEHTFNQLNDIVFHLTQQLVEEWLKPHMRGYFKQVDTSSLNYSHKSTFQKDVKRLIDEKGLKDEYHHLQLYAKAL